jgi:hypothetical protein
VLWKFLGLTMKKRIYNFKIIFIFQHNKTNTFISVMLHRHYPIPVVVLRKICKIPLYSCNHLLIKKNADQRGRVWVLGRDWNQREPNLGNSVDISTFRSADPLIFTLPKDFCGRVHCPDERWVFLLQTGSFLMYFFYLVWLKDWNNIPQLLFYSFQDNQ